MKSILLKSPEYIFIVLALLAGFTPPLYFSPICLILVVILLLQGIFKNRISGLILGTLFAFASLFFLLAVLSEFNEFHELNSTALSLISVGLGIWLLTIVLSLIMIYKYLPFHLKTD